MPAYPFVTDDLCAEIQDEIGSYFTNEAAVIDEAFALASLHPAALLGEQYSFGIGICPTR